MRLHNRSHALKNVHVVCAAGISNEQTCTQVGGGWTQPQCAVGSQSACTQHGGDWAPAPMWTLKGGVDLLIVGLLQVLAFAFACMCRVAACLLVLRPHAMHAPGLMHARAAATLLKMLKSRSAQKARHSSTHWKECGRACCQTWHAAEVLAHLYKIAVDVALN